MKLRPLTPIYLMLSLVGIVLVGLVIMLNVVLSSYTEADLKFLIEKEVKAATGRDLVIQGTIDSVIGFTPSITIRTLQLSSPTEMPSPYFLKADRLEVGVSLVALLTGTLRIHGLTLQGVDLLLETDRLGRNTWDLPMPEQQTDGSSEHAGSYEDHFRTALSSMLTMASHFDSVAVEDLRIIRRNALRSAERTFVFSEASIDASNGDRLLTLDIRGREDDSVITLNSTIEQASSFLSGDASLGLDFNFEAGSWSVFGDGQIIPNIDASHLDLKLSSQGSAIRQVIKDLDELFTLPPLPPLPEQISFQATGQLSGSVNVPVIDQIEANLTGTSSSTLRFNGRLLGNVVEPQLDGEIAAVVVDIGEYGRIVAPDLLDWSLPWLSAQGGMAFSGTLKGALTAPSLTEAHFAWGRSDVLRLTIAGQAGNILDLTNIAANIKLTGADLPELRGLALRLGAPNALESWPPIGTFVFMGDVTSDNAGRFTLSNLQTRLGHEEALSIDLSGYIHDPASLQTLNLSASVSGQDSPLLRRILEDIAPSLPMETTARLGRFHAAGALIWSSGVFSVQNGAIRLQDFHGTHIAFSGDWHAPAHFRFEGVLDSAGEDTGKMIRDTGLLFGQDYADTVPQGTSETEPSIPFALTTKFLVTADRLDSPDIDLTFGRTGLRASLRITDVLQRPQVTTDIKEAKIYLPDLVSLFGITENKGEDLPPSKVFSDTPIREVFNGWDGRFTFSGGFYGNDAPIIERVTIKAQLEQDTLTLESLHVGSNAGSASAQGSWNFSPTSKGHMEIDGRVDNVELGAILVQSDIIDWLSGAPMSGTLSGTSTGLSAHALAANFNGKVKLSLGPGTISNDKADWLSGDLLSNVYSRLNPFSGQVQKSELVCGAVAVNIVNGVTSFNNGLGFETKRIAVLGSGVVDLGREEMDIALASTPKDGLGLTVSGSGTVAHLKGAISNPVLSMDDWAAAKRGLSVGAAYLTGGVSVILQTLSEWASGNRNSCQAVLQP